MKDETMDNQQRRIEERLSWLGGIIDGEGCITACQRRYKNKPVGFIPRIGIVNTDMNLINEVVSILEKVKLPFHVRSQKDKKHPHWKIKFEIYIIGIKRCVKSLPILIPYIISKKEKAVRLLSFCESRLSKPIYSSYTDFEIDLLKKVRYSPIPFREHTPLPVMV